MYDTRTVFRSYIVARDYPESLLRSFLPASVFRYFHRFHPRNQLFVFHSYQVSTLILTYHLERNQFVARLVVFQCQFFRLLVEVCIQQRLGQYHSDFLSCITVISLYGHIVNLRTDTQCRIRRQCPRSSGPCDKVRRTPLCHFRFRVLHLELSYHRCILHVTVTARLVQLVRTQSGTCCRRIRLDSISLVQQSLLVQLLQQPPQSLDVTVVISDVRIFQVHPVTHLMSKVRPLLSKLHHVGTAMLVVFRYRNRLTDILFGNTQGLFHTQFHRQSVSIPSSLTLHLITFHGFKTAERILNGTSHHMVNSRHTIC